MVVFPHPSAPPCVCLCLSTYLHLSSCPRRPPLPLRVCLCLFVSVWVCLRLSSCPRRPLACLSLSLCVCLCLSVSVYVSASFFVSPPRVSVCVFVSVWLCLRLPAHLRLSSCPRRPSPPLRVCLRVFVSVCVCLHIACFLSSRAEILRCVGAAEPGRRPLNKRHCRSVLGHPRKIQGSRAHWWKCPLMQEDTWWAATQVRTRFEGLIPASPTYLVCHGVSCPSKEVCETGALGSYSQNKAVFEPRKIPTSHGIELLNKGNTPSSHPL